MRRLLVLFVICLCCSILYGQSHATVVHEIGHGTSPLMRNVKKPPPNVRLTLPELKTNHVPKKRGTADSVLQKTPTILSPSSIASFEGIGITLGVSDCCEPPDVNGAAGLTQYVQWVNDAYAVFDKATGKVLLAPQYGPSVWYGVGGACGTYSGVDPVVKYDRMANRWVFAQALFPGQTSQNIFCVAVSVTSDATGAYYGYAFPMPNFPDYAKLSVWPDAYYVTSNLFAGSTFIGAYACALPRLQMLVGTAANMQCFQEPSSVDSLLPADLDGQTLPPAGSPNYILGFNGYNLDLYKFHVDFATPANSSLTGPLEIPIAPYVEETCGGGACIPQSGASTTLDSLANRLMHRVSYRNFGAYESLLATHSVDPGNYTSGVRWYEVRNISMTPTVYQQGTYAPDVTWRWMPSIAQDGNGDIAVGYSVSSSTIYPGIRYAGRLASDPLGALEAETSVVEGTGAQININRWGDYNSMSIDPADDCTFWYTNEYLTTTNWYNWSTKVASFKFPSCTALSQPPQPAVDFSISAVPVSQTASRNSTVSFSVSIAPVNSFSSNVSFSVTGLPNKSTAGFNPASVNGSGSTTLSVAVWRKSPLGTYKLNITGTSGSLQHSTSVSLTVQ